MTTWEAYAGMTLVSAGKKRNGKPHTVLAIQVLVVVTESDAKRLTKANPQLTFVKKTRPVKKTRAARMKGGGSDG